MLKNKIVTLGLAGVLAMSGLAACGNQATTTSEPAKTESAKTETSSTDVTGNTVVYWEGKLADGQEVAYMDDAANKAGTLSIMKSDASDGKAWSGKYTTSDTKVTLKDDLTGDVVTFTVLSASDDTSTFKINIEGYGEATMKPVTADEFAKRVGNELAKVTVYWEGTLADKSSVSYMDGGEDIESILSVANANGSDSKTWTGKAVKQDNKVTITDTQSKEAVTFTILTSSDSVMKLNIEGYGEVELKPVSGSEAMKKAGDELAKTTLYWQGALADGSTVVYMFDADANDYTLGVIKADASDAKLWSGKGVVEDLKTTITDTESKQTIAFTVLNVADDLSSLKINIEGYGEVELKPVNAGDFAKMAEELATALK